MAHVVLEYDISVASLAKILTSGLVASGTGIGCVVALGDSLGMSWNIALGVTNAIMLGMATYYYVKYMGFKQISQSIFGVTLYTSVSKI